MVEIRLVEYDPDWPAQFERLRSMILRELPDARVEHIGSTSVPGCQAKPVIDISIGLAPGSSVRDAVFRAAGLRFRSVHPYSMVFAIDHPDGSRHANVHVRYKGTAAELLDLRFRDFLRSHPGAVRDYVEAKQRAMSSSRASGDYTRAKAPFIEGLLRDVERWADETRWSPG